MEIEHSGVKRKSGRFEYGSGEVPYQHEPWFTWSQEDKRLKESGMTDAELARYFHLKTTELRARRAIVVNEKLKADVAEAVKLKNKGMSNYAIAERLGVREGTIRNYLKPNADAKAKELDDLCDVLKSSMEKNVAIDVGKSIESYLGVSDTKLNAAINKLTMEGYVKTYYNVRTNGQNRTSIIALSKPLKEGEEWKDRYAAIQKDLSQIKMPVEVHLDPKNKKYVEAEYPASLSSKRVFVKYVEDGGKEKDGVVEIRRGVKDINLGNDMYAQVRILVDGDVKNKDGGFGYYIKGMAVYGDNIPDGYDVVVWSNKSKEKGLYGNALKNCKPDPDNPFGATITAAGQLHYTGTDGKEHLGVVNKVKEEDDWGHYKKNLASQFLAKQDKNLAKQQLDIDLNRKKDMLKSIESINNSVVREQLLMNFAGTCDTASYELKAAALPRQAAKVLLPLKTIAPNEVYAPTYRNGEEVILVRYPHGGTFEIPRLIVNNNNAEAKKFMKNAPTAIGISKQTAEILSGADFDGDTAVVIPTQGIKIKTTSPLEGLKGFDPDALYPERPGMKYMTEGKMKQQQMGIISNLITDMTIEGATASELARAVRHSMVVIDAPKHKYDFKKSEEENGIEQLHEKFQGSKRGGAQTLLSKAKGPATIDEIDYNKFKIDKDTGEISYLKTGRTYIATKKRLDDDGNPVRDEKGKIIRDVLYDRNGNPKEIKAQTETNKMSKVRDARDLIGFTNSDIENIYADYANGCKALANQCRKGLFVKKAGDFEYSATAAEIYKNEVASLMAKMNDVDKNAPLERQAQLLKDSAIKKMKESGVQKDGDEYKKFVEKTIKKMRAKTGAEHRFIDVTKKEWEAMNAGAIHKTLLKKIISKMDGSQLSSYALPKEQYSLTRTEINRIKMYADNGFTYAEIADALGISTSTVGKYLKEG